MAHRSRSSATTRGSSTFKVQNLPLLRRDMPLKKLQNLFKLKLELCTITYDFDDQAANKRARNHKRQILLELVKFTNNQPNQKIFSEAAMPAIVEMLEANVFRDLPPQQNEEFDPEEEEHNLDSSWPHLQAVYEFMLRFIVSTEVKAKVARKYLTKKFCKRMIDLFDSEDPRERDYLKTILHRIYGKFMTYRSVIRRYIQYTFYMFVYETERHNGIGELLEILGSIINGFTLPLKKEHEAFLVRALVPLHKPKCVGAYHLQLSYCMTQFVEKEPGTTELILCGLIKYWPWSSSAKQVLFLNELEDLMELLEDEMLEKLYEPLFNHLGRCLASTHFQVQERTLYLWNNEHLVNSGCLSKPHCTKSLTSIHYPLQQISKGHWNGNVQNLAQNVIKLYMAYDLSFFNKMAQKYIKEEETKEKVAQQRQQNWASLEQAVEDRKIREQKEERGREEHTAKRAE